MMEIREGQVWRNVRSGLAIRVRGVAPLTVMYPHGSRRGIVMKPVQMSEHSLRRYYRPESVR